MLITQTESHPFCILKTRSDTMFDALFDDGSYPKRPRQKRHVLQMWSYLGPQGIPRHDLNAFHVKCDD